MKRRYFCMIVLATASLYAGIYPLEAQTTKYDRGGSLRSIGGLLDDLTGCEASKVFAGSISKIAQADSDAAAGYEFTLKLNSGKLQRFIASVPSSDGGLVEDFAELMIRGRRLSIKARQCGSGGFWTAEEIWRSR